MRFGGAHHQPFGWCRIRFLNHGLKQARWKLFREGLVPRSKNPVERWEKMILKYVWEICSQAVSVHCLTSRFRSWYLIWPNRSTLSQLLEFHASGNQFDMENLCRKSFIYREWWRNALPSTAARVPVIMESYDPTTSKASHCTCYRTYTQPVSSHSKPIKTQIVSRLVDLGENKHESLTCKHV